jgi:hypothetical protein
MPLTQSTYYTQWINQNLDWWWMGRLELAICDVASDILVESEGVPDHDKRVRWALESKQSPNSMAKYIESYVQEQATYINVGKVMFDADLKACVSAVVPLAIKKY